MAEYLTGIGGAWSSRARTSASARAGRDVELLRSLGLDVRPVPLVEGVSSSRIRGSSARATSARRPSSWGGPTSSRGRSCGGDQRGGTLGFPTANLAPDPHALVPAYGIYAGEALGHRVAASIGVNPHYGGSERRIEAFLLDFTGDLYGDRLRLELWERLREEARFERGRPRGPDRRRRRGRGRGRPGHGPPAGLGARRERGQPAASRVGGAAAPSHHAHAAEVVVLLLPQAHVVSVARERLDRMSSNRARDGRSRRSSGAADGRRPPAAEGPRPGSPRAPAQARAGGGCLRRRRRRARAPRRPGRRSATSCSPCACRDRAARRGDRTPRACCSGGRRSPGGSRRSRARGWS